MLSATATDLEPNDSAPTAVVFQEPADQQVQLTGTSDSSKDKDYFAFVPTQSGTWSATVTSPNNNLAQLEVESSSGVYVETDPSDGVNSLSFNATAGQQIFLRLRSENLNPAAYIVNLQGSSSSDPGSPQLSSNVQDTEPNDTEHTAQPFGLSDTNTATLTGVSTSSTDVDFYSVKPGKAGFLNVQVESPQGNAAQVEMEIEGTDTEAESEPHDGVHAASLAVAAGQQIFVRVKSTNADPSQYIVHVSLTDQPIATGPTSGDLDSDGDVDKSDYQLFHDHFNPDDHGVDGVDMNEDGSLDGKDYVLIANNLGHGSVDGPRNNIQMDPQRFKAKFAPPQYYSPSPTLPKTGLYGDSDGDWDVDSADMLESVSQWTGSLDNTAVDIVYQTSDIDGDGDVDSEDVLNLLANWTGAE